jgi:hypothetical protein
MALDIARFTGSDDEVAQRFERADLPGILRKRLDLPKGVVALIRPADGAPRAVVGPAGAPPGRATRARSWRR